MNTQLLLASCLIFTPLIYAELLHSSEFDAHWINEESKMWPFERYGKIFNVDHSAQRFEFVKNAVYDEKDPPKIIGRSRNCVHWSKDTVFINTEVMKDFSGIKTPVVVRFLATNGKEAQKMSQASDFSAITATVLLSAKNAEGIKAGKDEVVAVFTPDSPNSGTLQINSKPVKVTMTKRRSKITTEKMVEAGEMKEGDWSALIRGAESNQKFVAQRV